MPCLQNSHTEKDAEASCHFLSHNFVTNRYEEGEGGVGEGTEREQDIANKEVIVGN